MLAFFSLATSLLVATLAQASVLPQRRDTKIWQSPFTGTIIAPVADADVAPDAAFPFAYAVSNWCESSFTPFTVYLTTGVAPPAFGNVTANGELAEGTYEFQFGKYTVSNFGLPLPEGSDPPPTSLMVPAGFVSPTQSYITVVQEFDGCPGHIAVEYSLTSVPLSVGAAV